MTPDRSLRRAVEAGPAWQGAGEHSGGRTRSRDAPRVACEGRGGGSGPRARLRAFRRSGSRLAQGAHRGTSFPPPDARCGLPRRPCERGQAGPSSARAGSAHGHMPRRSCARVPGPDAPSAARQPGSNLQSDMAGEARRQRRTHPVRITRVQSALAASARAPSSPARCLTEIQIELTTPPCHRGQGDSPM
jgi:hypothetical protein